MMTTTGRLANLLILLAGAASAQELSLPSTAVLTHEEGRSPSSYALPLAAWHPEFGLRSQEMEGPVTLRAFRLDGSGLTPLQLMTPLRSQLIAQGFEILLDCAAQACGGFDFRFATEVISAPAMYVDLSQYRFLSARGDNGSGVSILVSRDRDAGFVQVIRVGRAAPVLRTDAPAPVALRAPLDPGSLGARLEGEGYVVLDDVIFASGSAALAEGAVGSLDALTDYLLENPNRRVLFVGHTDAVGSLDGNQALSRTRAGAVLGYLSARGVPSAQISAEGAGYLSPRASNLTPEGRALNRRVEAVLLSTE